MMRVHDFLDVFAVVTVCMRCGLAEREPGWERCVDQVDHELQIALAWSVVRNPKTGRVMLIERMK